MSVEFSESLPIELKSLKALGIDPKFEGLDTGRFTALCSLEKIVIFLYFLLRKRGKHVSRGGNARSGV